MAQYRYVYPLNQVSLLTVHKLPISDLHYAMVWPKLVSEPTWEAVKFQGNMPPDASALCTEVRTNVVCPCCALAPAVSWLHHCHFLV